MTDIYQKLAAPFPPDVVSWRVGSMNKDKTKGMALAYIDARDVMNRLDEVVGPANWQATYPHANGKTICAIGIKCGDEWVWKANGAGDTDIEAEKGAISDALKRAAVLWGIGRYLYDLPSPWVAVNQYKQIEENEYSRLRKLLTPSPPSSPARNAGGSPASSPTRQDEPPATSHTAYIATFKLAVERCEYETDIIQLWNEQKPEREKLGITKESPAYKVLSDLCAKQKAVIATMDEGEAA